MDTAHASRPEQRIQDAADRLRTGGDWLDAMRLAARLRGFSFANTLLIADQHHDRQSVSRKPVPEPSMLATRMEWSRVGCQVGGNQIGYTILADGGRGGFVVCDIAQLTPDSTAPVWRDLVLRGGRAPAGLLTGLEGLIRQEGYRVAHRPDSTGGGVDWGNQVVRTRFDATPAEQARMAATGLARLDLRGPAAHGMAGFQRDPDVEAASAASIICAAHGMVLDQHPAGLVDSWAGRPGDPARTETILTAGETARQAALAILGRLDTAQCADGTLASLNLPANPTLFGAPAPQTPSGMAVGI